MACKYIYNGNTYENYQTLISTLEEKMRIGELSELADILFSQASRQDIIFDVIDSLKTDAKLTKENLGMIDGSPDISHDENTFTTQTFIDSNLFQINGKPPIFRLTTEDYVKTMKDKWVQDKSMTQEAADAWGATVQARWDSIAENALDFHKLILSPPTDSLYEWSQRTVGTAFAGVTDRVKSARDAIIRQVFLRNGIDKQGSGNRGKLITNLNFSAELKETAEKILGHIDYIMIRDDGDIEIFNVKTSTEFYNQWSTIKKEKYKYQMALLKQMLAFNGINTKNVRLNIIPVRIKYNNNYDTVEGITVQDAISIDTYNMQYNFGSYDRVAANFIDSSVDFTPINDESLLKVTTQLQHIFPGKDVAAKGIAMSAEEWITRNWNYCHPVALPNNTGWTIVDPDTKEQITLDDPRKGASNKKFVEYVQKKLENGSDPFNGDVSAANLAKDIRRSFKFGFFSSNMTSVNNNYIPSQFEKYFEAKHINPDGTFRYDWELIKSPTLEKANIIAFRHKESHQLDVFTISNTNPSTTYSFKNRKNLLGYYLPDLNSENFTMECNYGNIDAIRTIALLNEVLPAVEGEIKLGQLKVIGLSNYHTKKGAYFDFEHLLKQWNIVVKVVNKNTSAGIVNNFRENGIECILPEEVVLQTWRDITRSSTNIKTSELNELEDIIDKKIKIDGSTIDGLVDLKTVEAKITKLELIIEQLRKMAPSNQLDVNNLNELVRASNGPDSPRSRIAKLYIVTTQALSKYYGDTVVTNEDFSTFQEYAAKTGSIGNTNVRRVEFLVRKSIDNIRDTIMTTYFDNARKIIMQYYEDCGYSKAQNSVIGNQTSMFKNLYQVDDKGNNIFLFKNPYDPASDLKVHEREFLKKILFEFHKVRCAMNHKANELKGINDSKLQANLPPELKNYLFVPLQRASSATRRANLRNNLVQKGNRIMRMIHDPKAAVEEFSGYLSQSDIDMRDSLIETLRVYNPYTRSEISLDERDAYINAKGAGYFETNVENIFIDFLSKQVECDEFNKLLIRIKGIELGLTLLGIAEGDDKAINHTIKTIDDFVTLNVFNKPIMEKGTQKVDMWLQPFRRFVSDVYIAANPVAMVRDTLQGLQENFIKSAIKFQTDINAADVAFGYSQVLKEGCSNMMTMTLLNQFNIKYGFSNFDAAKVAERLKTGRGGVLNADNWAYFTLRAPDYLNRMTLFVAKLHHDGAFDAYSLDSDHRLKYDWRKDKRFSVYASGDTSNPEYNKQRGFYYSLIRAFNVQNPSLNLKYTDDLPDAYTPEQIRSIKTLGETIYGAYDKAAKAKYENIAIGRNFMFFSTWMNGIVDTYFKPAQISQTELKLEQETDYNGNPLFFTADQSGNTTTEDTGIPVYKYVPIMVQGVWQTFGQSLKELRNGGWSSFKSNVWSNAVNRRNYKRFMSDMGIMLLLGLLFRFWITPAYKEHKKNDDGKKIFTNVAAEMLYKGGYASFDTFKGPIAILTYLGESTNPASYALQSKVISDGYNWLMGNRTSAQTLMGSQAFFRSAQDSYRMWMRDHQG